MTLTVVKSDPFQLGLISLAVRAAPMTTATTTEPLDTIPTGKTPPPEEPQTRMMMTAETRTHTITRKMMTTTRRRKMRRKMKMRLKQWIHLTT